jgi:hypothetical protein
MAAGTIGIATMGKSSPQSSTPSALTVPVDAAGGETSPDTPSEAEPSDEIPASSSEIIDGEPTLEVTRPTGEKITVALLRSPEDHSADEVVASLMGLVDCWGTTGDQACLDAISSRPDTQQVVVDMMSHIKSNVLEINNLTTAPKAFQVDSFKDPSDPANFVVERSGSTYTYTLAGGTMRVNPFTTGYEDDLKWRDPQTLNPDYNFSYKLVGEDFSLVVTNNAEGKPEVKTLNWTLTNTSV